MKKVIIQFVVQEIDETAPGNTEMHTRSFLFSESFDEAKRFLDSVMQKRITLQEGKDPVA